MDGQQKHQNKILVLSSGRALFARPLFIKEGGKFYGKSHKKELAYFRATDTDSIYYWLYCPICYGNLVVIL
jgi:hypothetical protein